jgi:trans-aconitate 2-methyltransferase
LEALPKGRVIGLDLSQNMLRTARENLEPRFCGRLQVVAADLLSLPFDQVFDGVFSTAAFHWVMDHDRLFEQLFHALIPGGWLIAQCGGGPNLARLRDRANHLMASPKFATFFDGFVEPWLYSDAESAGERLCRAGFMEVETSLEAAPTVLEDASHFSEFIESVIFHRHLERIPDQASRGQLIAELTAAGASDDPPYSLDYWRLNLSGKKPRA